MGLKSDHLFLFANHIEICHYLKWKGFNFFMDRDISIFFIYTNIFFIVTEKVILICFTNFRHKKY